MVFHISCPKLSDLDLDTTLSLKKIEENNLVLIQLTSALIPIMQHLEINIQFVHEGKKDFVDRIICDTKCVKNQDYPIHVKSVHEKNMPLQCKQVMLLLCKKKRKMKRQSDKKTQFVTVHEGK